jgi:ABC-type multidrug transport system permease subunit
MRGPLRHLLLTLRLNFRSPQALVYGYLVPIFFLVAFAAIDKTVPTVWHELGALLTITTLGGACFGMPTAMVAERERGLWRRYRLLPGKLGGVGAIIVSTVIARLILVATAAAMQIGLAKLIYRMPMPDHPWQLIVAFALTAFAFLGLGLVIAMLAGSVPAVQAMGQCIFLPMIIIGGIGVPLSILPTWAQRTSQFLPGRYAAEAMQACVSGGGLGHHRFDLLALLLFGLGGFLAASKIFRWEAGRSLSAKAWTWAALSLLPWAAVGIAAWTLDRPAGPIEPTVLVAPTSNWQSITPADIDAIQYTGLEPDQSTVTPLAENLQNLDPARAAQLAELSRKLDNWPPAKSPDPVQRFRNLLGLAGIVDLSEDPDEPYVPLIVLQRMRAEQANQDVEKILTWIITHPAEGSYPTAAPELGWATPDLPADVRQRATDYARKLLGKLTGRRKAWE